MNIFTVLYAKFSQELSKIMICLSNISKLLLTSDKNEI